MPEIHRGDIGRLWLMVWPGNDREDEQINGKRLALSTIGKEGQYPGVS